MSDKEIEEKAKKITQITQLKCDIFDIIRQQELLQGQINQLQNLKVQKIQELQKLESSQ